MERLLRQPSSKAVTNISENSSSNEVGKDFSVSEMDELETFLAGLPQIANNLELWASEELWASTNLESQQHRFEESEQRTSQQSECGTNFLTEGYSYESAAANLGPESSCILLHEENPLDVGTSNCVVSVPQHVSHDKEEIVNNRATSSISETIDREESDFNESNILKSSIHELETFMSTFFMENKVQNIHSITDEHSEGNSDHDTDYLSDEDPCVPSSFEEGEKGIFSYYPNISMKTGNTGSRIISHRQEGDSSQSILQSNEKPGNEISYLADFQVCENRINEFYTSGELFVPVNGAEAVADASGMNVQAESCRARKSYICPDCGKDLRLKSNFVRHLLIHTGEKPFACDQCGKRFRRKDHLSLHYGMHTAEKPFACDQCGKRFRRKNHLSLHYGMHTGEKPFVCDECGKRFARNGDRNRHRQIHTRDKPYKCPICDLAFKRKYICYAHYKKIHCV